MPECQIATPISRAPTLRWASAGLVALLLAGVALGPAMAQETAPATTTTTTDAGPQAPVTP